MNDATEKSQTTSKVMAPAKTAAQVVKELGIKRGDTIEFSGGVTGRVSSVSNNGEVLVRGSRQPVDVHSLHKVNN